MHSDCITNYPILSEGEIRMSATSNIKAKRIANNLFATSNGFRKDLMASLAVMLQLQPSNLGVCSRNLKTLHCKERKKGLHDSTLTHCSVIETQNRGTLHIQMLIWTGVLPLLLQKYNTLKK